MAVIDIDEAKTMIWKQEVETELSQVEEILKKVQTELTTVAGSDDSIYQGIYKVGVAVEETWNETVGSWRKCIEYWTEAIRKMGLGGQAVLDSADALKAKMGGR